MSENTLFGQDGKYIDVGENKIYYYEEGVGAPVIFIHGIGQSIFTFRKNINEFAACFRVIAVDLIGHGNSDKPEIKYTISDYSEMIYSFMQALEIENAHFFAFSTGGIITIDLALKHPEVVKKLMLISPGGLTEHYPAKIKNLTIPLLSDFIFHFSNRRSLEKVLASGYFDRTNLNDQVVEGYYKFLSEDYSLDSVITTFNNWDDQEILDSLCLIQSPTYIFWGECDTWHPIELLELFEDYIEDLYSATVRNGGHFVHEEKFRELNRKAIELLLIEEMPD